MEIMVDITEPTPETPTDFGNDIADNIAAVFGEEAAERYRQRHG